jgi:hypothetical protein
MTPGSSLRPAAVVREARDAIPWVADHRLEEVEPRSPWAAALLSLFTWGGGHLMAYDKKRGFAFLFALLAFSVLVSNLSFLPGALVSLVYLAAGAVAAVDAYRRADAVTRYFRARAEQRLSGQVDLSHYRLLASAAAVDPRLAGSVPMLAAHLSPPPAPTGVRIASQPDSRRFGAVVAQLRKLCALRNAGVITDVELASRKVDLFASVAPEDRATLDQLLYELLPLAEEGVLDAADFEFIKGASAGR